MGQDEGTWTKVLAKGLNGPSFMTSYHFMGAETMSRLLGHNSGRPQCEPCEPETWKLCIRGDCPEPGATLGLSPVRFRDHQGVL